MQVTVTDERSRITLGKKIEKKFGKRFIVIATHKEVILMPYHPPKDPVKDLQDMMKDSEIGKYSIKQLKKIALEEAEKEAMADLADHFK
jgi:hypothetical protein